ncbi:Protein ACTIVITY OF BC1 COMPLEX KINASE 8 [Cardamine amara subsp. amara]|uniref:Protein ACTIVITY OF BC1 COMPLEX KINASE 8 n=1 Tax=Cardamine amara subsp. amara TaxID=228776 RepID=A0ABD0ZAH9_CARAN
MTLISRFVISRVVTQSLFTNQIGRKAITVSLRLPQFRTPSHQNHTLAFLHNVKGRSFLSNSTASNVVKQQAQVSWKRLLHRYSMQQLSMNLPRLSQIAQAFSLSLVRSHFLLPGFFALGCRQVACAQRVAPSPVIHRPSHISHYSSRINFPIVLSSLLFSAVKGVALIGRALYLAVLFSPNVIMALLEFACGPQFRKLQYEVLHRTLERAGPAFIKFGQWIATRPDRFNKDLCLQLSKLHSNAPEHNFAFTKKSIESAFGRKLSDIFEEFDEAPVASGSIAQVHRAFLKFQYPGQKVKSSEVAVKVRHPCVEETMKRDFVIINFVARLTTYIPGLNWLRLDECVQQFSVYMLSQVDLSREASHLSRFIYNFRGWKDVSFPKPVYPLVHPAVLVETYEHGESVARYVDGSEGHERLKAKVAHIGTHALLKMLLVDNFIHADMHPGNILVRPNDTPKGFFRSKKPHIVFLDVGMTAELSKVDRDNLLGFFKAVARRDGKTAAERTLKLSKQQNCPNPQAFIEEVEEAFTFWGTEEGDVVHPADCMHELFEKMRRHRVNIDGNVSTVMFTTLVLEGWQRKLDPGYDVMRTLQTMLLKNDWMKSLSYTVDGLMAP